MTQYLTCFLLHKAERPNYEIKSFNWMTGSNVFKKKNDAVMNQRFKQNVAILIFNNCANKLNQ